LFSVEFGYMLLIRPILSYCNLIRSSIALQVKAGSIFDNILICDDPQYAREIVKDVFQNREVNYWFYSPCGWLVLRNMAWFGLSFYVHSRSKKMPLRKQRKWEELEKKRWLTLFTCFWKYAIFFYKTTFNHFF